MATPSTHLGRSAAIPEFTDPRGPEWLRRATALHRLITSDLAGKYSLIVMRQEHAAGGFDIALIKRWVAQLRRIRPDMVHVRGMGNEGFHAALAARIARCPRILVSVHGSVRELTGERT